MSHATNKRRKKKKKKKKQGSVFSLLDQKIINIRIYFVEKKSVDDNNKIMYGMGINFKSLDKKKPSFFEGLETLQIAVMYVCGCVVQLINGE